MNSLSDDIYQTIEDREEFQQFEQKNTESTHSLSLTISTVTPTFSPTYNPTKSSPYSPNSTPQSMSTYSSLSSSSLTFNNISSPINNSYYNDKRISAIECKDESCFTTESEISNNLSQKTTFSSIGRGNFSQYFHI